MTAASAPETDLLERIQAAADAEDVAVVRRLLREPFVTPEIVDAVLERRELLSANELRRDLAAHPKTREVRALRLVPTLYWRDLVRLGADSRVRPAVRRAADLALGDRLAKMAVGEKMSIARAGGHGVIHRLRHDPSPRVIAALLDNPRLSEPLLMPMVASETASPPVLSLVAAHRKWGRRPAVRAAVCRNPRTPLPTVLANLALLPKRELQAVRSDARMAEPVRRKAALLLGL